MLRAFVCLVGALACVLASGAAAQPTMPREFVYLRDVDPSIRQDIRYAGSHNFVGRSVAGYAAAECVLTAKAAEALKRVQAALSPRGFSLIVWDCYRPARAVADFMRWTKDGDTRTKAEFYPRLEKNSLVALGYIAARSTHSSGSSVDLGFVSVAPAAQPPAIFCAPANPPDGGGNVVDVGTAFDCFDERAHFASRAIGAAAQENRALLRSVMAENGFAPYEREWWHFRLIDEPFRGRVFDFPIVPHPRGPQPVVARPTAAPKR